MNAERRQPPAVDGQGRTVRGLLGGRKYSIHYYQREHKWQSKQVAELVDDLAGKFLEHYESGDERTAVVDYGHYFLGSIIISDKDGQKFVIDGQQRLTTLTLLLIFRRHLAPEHRAERADSRVDILPAPRQAVVQSRHPRAQRMLKALLSALGFEHVKVVFEEPPKT